MLAYSNTSLKLLMLVTVFTTGLAVVSSPSRAQDKVKEVPPTINEVVEVVVPQPDSATLEGADSALNAQEDLRAPVPMLETGEYVFEDGGAPVRAPSDGKSSNTTNITEYDIGGDAFYDTDAILPKGKVGKAGPAPVDPKKNPASKFVIVEAVTPKTGQSAQLVSAERAMSLGRYDSALQLYDDLYEKNRKDLAVLMGRAVCLQKLGRFDEAMQTYEELSILEPKNTEVQINMLGLLATRYPSVALRRLMDLHDEDQQNVGLVAQIAVTAANLGDFDTAMRYLGIAMGMQPENASHIFNAAVILDRAGSTKDAITYYEKALEVDSIYGGSRTVPREVIYERLAHIR